jgi:hypothetical protein
MSIQPPNIQPISLLKYGQVTQIAKEFGVARVYIHRALQNPPRADGKDSKGKARLNKKSKLSAIHDRCMEVIRQNMKEMQEAINAFRVQA